MIKWPLNLIVAAGRYAQPDYRAPWMLGAFVSCLTSSIPGFLDEAVLTAHVYQTLK